MFILLPDPRGIEACVGNLIRFVIFREGDDLRRSRPRGCPNYPNGVPHEGEKAQRSRTVSSGPGIADGSGKRGRAAARHTNFT